MSQILKSLTKKSYDFVVVGAGSAGCAIASRLTENPKVKVALLEAGPEDKSPFIHIPFGIIGIVAVPGIRKINWYFENQGLEKYTGVPSSKKWYQPRGKTLGGSSSINAMIYIRGHKKDYEDWAALGNKGWDYESVLPYFKKSEINENIEDKYHGNNGSLNV